MSAVNKRGFNHIDATTVSGARYWNVERLWKLSHALEPELVEVERLSGIDRKFRRRSEAPRDLL